MLLIRPSATAAGVLMISYFLQGSGLWLTVIAIYLSFLVENYVMLVCCVGRYRSLRGLFTMLLLLVCNESDKI